MFYNSNPGNTPGRYRIYKDVNMGKAIAMMAEFRLSTDRDECKNAIPYETSALLVDVPYDPYNMSYQVDEDGNRIYTVIEIMPKYPGGQQNGEVVVVRYTMPVTFR